MGPANSAELGLHGSQGRRGVRILQQGVESGLPIRLAGPEREGTLSCARVPALGEAT